MATTFGTASVQLQWESGELRGYVNNLIYYIISTNIEVSSRSSKINVTNDDGLALGTSVEFQVSSFVVSFPLHTFYTCMTLCFIYGKSQ